MRMQGASSAGETHPARLFLGWLLRDGLLDRLTLERAMNLVVTCPDRTVLQRLLLGQLSFPDSQRLAQHLPLL